MKVLEPLGLPSHKFGLTVILIVLFCPIVFSFIVVSPWWAEPDVWRT